ncbi:MAG: hypothetical protein Q9201_000821 [Fulgogasparrea decipioides]
MIESSSRNSLVSEREANDGPSTQHESPGDSSFQHKATSDNKGSPVPTTTREHPSRRLREKISHLREQVIMGRLELREQRVGMREQHGVVRSLEAQLLRQWQRYGASLDQDAIDRLHTELCTALDELGPMEEEYDEKEDGLDTLEYDLEASETRFYRRYAQSDPGGSHRTSSPCCSPTSTFSEEPDLPPTAPQDFLSPRYLYLSRIGEANAVRERLMELEEQKAHYLEIERERNALGIPLYQENVEFLSNYGNTYAEQVEALEMIEKDIQDLAMRIGYSSEKNANDPVIVRGVGRHSENNAGYRQRSPATEPGQAGQSNESIKESLRRKSETDVWNLPDDPQSSRDRINQWILGRLKESRFEEAMHRTILHELLNDSKLDRKRWWKLVREYWQQDRAARSSKNSSSHASGLTTSARPQELRSSLDPALYEVSDAPENLVRVPSVVKQASPAGIFAQPRDDKAANTEGYTDNSICRLHYLDLAAEPSFLTKKAPEKFGAQFETLTSPRSQTTSLADLDSAMQQASTRTTLSDYCFWIDSHSDVKDMGCTTPRSPPAY